MQMTVVMWPYQKYLPSGGVVAAYYRSNHQRLVHGMARNATQSAAVANESSKLNPVRQRNAP